MNLEELVQSEPKKSDELAALHWFTQAEKIAFDELLVGDGGLAKEERPDFRLLIGGRIIGVELTVAERELGQGSFSAHKIEAAQNKFAKRLEDNVRPALPIIITLAFNDEIAVNTENANLVLPLIASKIEELAAGMGPHSSAILVHPGVDLDRYSNAHVCAELPEFLQNIQFFNDGQDFSAVTGSRGGVVKNFTETDLGTILEKKHRALTGYRTCDEHWLVIVSGIVPPIVLPKERQRVQTASMATYFADVEVARPITSDFDRVYFFKSPTQAICLTQAP